MLGSIQFSGAAEVINAGALGLLPTSADAFKLGFLVEEDEMLVEFRFKGYLSAAGVLVSYQLLLDGAAIGAADGAAAAAFAEAPIEFSKIISLSKGIHKVDLALGDLASTGVSLNGATFPAELSVHRLSNDAALAHGVNAKSKGIF